MHLTRKIIRGITNNATLMSWSAHLVQFGSGLIVLPLILTKFDKTDQAFWFLIGTIRGFALLAEIGFGFIIIRAVSYFFSGLKKLPKNLEEYEQTKSKKNLAPNFRGLSDLLSTIKVIYIFLAVVVLLLVSTLGILTVSNLISLSEDPRHLWISYIFIAASTILYIQTIQWQNYMNGLDFVAKAFRFGTIMGILRITIFTLLLVLNYGIEFLSFYILIDTLFGYIYYRWFVNKWLKKNYKKCGKINFKKDIFKSLWPITWRTGLTQWGEYFLGSGLSILAAQIQNISLMASFLFTVKVFEMVRRTSEAPFYTHIPKIYRHMAVKDYSMLKKKASAYILASLVLLTTVLTILGLWGNQILTLIRIDTPFVPQIMFLLLSFTLLIEMHAGFHGNIYLSTNHIPFMIPMLISATVFMGVGYFFLDQLGLMGIVIMRLIILAAFLSWYQVKISLNLLSWKFNEYIFDIFTNSKVFFIEKTKKLIRLTYK